MARTRRKPAFWPLEFYSSAVGKKAVMAVTGLLLLGFLLAHMLGNLKIYAGATSLFNYAEYLREIGYPILPKSGLLWILRGGLIVAFALHIHAAVSLTLLNRTARPIGYKGGRNYAAASYAARTMRWSGVIVGLFLLFHLMDLTWGNANPGFVGGQPFNNVVASFERVPVAIVYIVANLALGLHIYHGGWSLFQSLGWSNPRFNQARKAFAVGLAVVIVLGNISFPLAVLTGVVEQAPLVDAEAAHGGSSDGS